MKFNARTNTNSGISEKPSSNFNALSITNTETKTNKRPSQYLVVGAAIGALVALTFGLTVPALNTSKEFAIVDMGWCANAPNIYDCSKSHLYAGLCNAALFCGSAVGSLFIGLTARFGRRVSIMIINWFFIIGSILSASAVNFGMLLSGRLLCGMAIGLEGMIPLFLIEICHPNSRKYFTFIQTFFLVIGQLLSVVWQLLHLRIVENYDSNGNPFRLSTLDKFVWRGSQLLPAISSLLALLLLHFVFTFDTPYELIEKGKTAEARDVIEKLHGAEAVDYVYDVFDQDCEIAKSTPNIPLHKALKNPKYRKIILHTFVLAALHQFSGVIIFVSNSTKLFMHMMGRSMKANVATTGIHLANFLTKFVLAFVIGKAGRKVFLLCGLGISTAFLTLASISKPIGKDAKWVPIVSLIGSFGCFLGFIVGLGSIFWIYLSEVYPPECNNGGLSGAVFILNLSAAITIFSSEYLISYSEVLMNIILFAVSLFALGFVSFFIRETKGVPLGKAYD